MHAVAILMLSTNLAAGTGTPRPAYIPPVQHFAFLATLAVHPSFTTRTYDVEKQAAADDALRYLRQVIKLVGPRNGGLDQAFRFVEAKKPAASRNKRAQTRNTADLDPEGEGFNADSIRSPFATTDSLWYKADDFWSVVGWAFNCSVVYPHRWRRWKVWLEMMLDVLEVEMESRASVGTIADSMFARYLAPVGGRGRDIKRRLMRAILADGKQTSLAEFHEVWRDETKGPKKERDEDAVRQGKKRKLDLGNSEFGDYGDDSSDEDSTAASDRRSRPTTAKPSRQMLQDADSDGGATANNRDVENSNGVDSFGGTSSLQLRARLLALLVCLCSHSPATFLDTEDLFDIFTEFTRPLPLVVFQHFVCPPRPYLDADAQSSMLQMLFRPLLAGSGAPVYDENTLTQDVFEENFAPFAAGGSGASDNAKVSIMVEGLLRLLWRHGGLVGRHSLREAVEQGVKARRERVAWDGRRRAGVKALEEEQAGMVMEGSVQRMMSLLELVR
ncbi:hypothetical protein B0A55_00227 [Friedmanniomyces simplex]|uniref:Uncharacterized protein n=1 Tax=Friedmanniomyces simplex TaxID=329884 RepID=A0A4U0Y6K9_9PEZI|nr:hypothetical protein B0A55_00227 [Friedmanniomyces simplex]